MPEANTASFQCNAEEAAWHMAMDESLLASVCSNDVPPTLRLYFWQHHAITVGRFQNIHRTVNLTEVSRADLPIVRRMTGGRGILHGPDLTIGIAFRLDTLGLPEEASVLTIYRTLSEGYIRALRLLGIPAERGVCNPPDLRDLRGDCFAVSSRADIIDNSSGKKLLGAAIFRRGCYVLQQASLPFRTTEFSHTSLFAGTRPTEPRGGFLEVSGEALCQAVIEGFQEAIGCRFEAQTPTNTERSYTTDLMTSRYMSAAWNEFR